MAARLSFQARGNRVKNASRASDGRVAGKPSQASWFRFPVIESAHRTQNDEIACEIKSLPSR
jgi:hypothetical protein